MQGLPVYEVSVEVAQHLQQMQWPSWHQQLILITHRPPAIQATLGPSLCQSCIILAYNLEHKSAMQANPPPNICHMSASFSGNAWLIRTLSRQQTCVLRAEQQPQCGSRPPLGWIQQPHLLRVLSKFVPTLRTRPGFGQEFMAMHLPAEYSDSANPPSSGRFMILGRCTGLLIILSRWSCPPTSFRTF